MGRKTRGRSSHYVPPVQKIELTDKNIKLRLAAAVLFLIIAVASITYGISAFLTGEAGWREIEVYSSAGVTCGDDFVFLYDVGSGASRRTEVRKLTALYSETAKTAYEIFNADTEIEGVSNLWYINHHPNKEISVDPALYNAFSILSEDGGRWVYLGPAYSVYDNLFYMQSPDGAVDFDPRLNSYIGELFQKICGFAGDPKAVNLELLENNTVRLNVSQEYLNFAAEEELEDFVDFYWLKNAFIADYMAERLLAEGYTRGVLSSYDGFVRCLDDEGTAFTFKLYHTEKNVITAEGSFEYSGPLSFVTFKSYPLNSRESQHYLLLSDGSVRTVYLSLEDGFDRCSMEELTAYSRNAGCGEIALKVAPVYIADEFRTGALTSLEDAGIYAVYWADGGFYSNGPLEQM